MQLQYVELITDKTNAADLSIKWRIHNFNYCYANEKKIENPLLFHKFHKKLANSGITKEALNCIASIAIGS